MKLHLNVSVSVKKSFFFWEGEKGRGMDKAGDVLKTEQAGFLKEVVCYCSCFVYLPSCVVCYVILQLFWKLYHMVILSSYYTPYSNVLIFTGIDVDVLICSSIYSYM